MTFNGVIAVTLCYVIKYECVCDSSHIAMFQMTNDYHRAMQAAVATENILRLK